MKKIKGIICVILALVVVCGSFMVSAGASGTIAYGAGEVSASILNIRSGPGTNNSIVSTVRNGSTVVILEKSTDAWYKISYNGTVGYVFSQYLTDVSQVKDFTASGKVNDSGVRYRSGPSTGSSILGSLNSGAEISVTGIDNGWYKIVYNGTSGYMRSDYIDIIETSSQSASLGSTSADTSDSNSEAGTVNADYVRFRKGPSLDSAIIRTLNSGTKVDVLSETTGWYKIVYSGTTGYMSSTYITLASEAASEPELEEMNTSGYVSGNYVRLRTGPSTNYSIISTLNYGTSVQVLGKTNGWYKISYNGSTGYMCGDYITIGDAPSSGGTSLGEKIAAYCKQFVGYPYVYGGASPSTGFDCSGLMYYVYGQFGYTIQRGAGSQYAYSGKSVAKSDLQPGDLVFFSSNGFESVTHVGMYIGNNKFVHASGTDVGVIISDLTTSYYTRVYYGAKRII
jgi:uncharacterized protein YgiM (DUF1202 family)